VPVDPRIDTDLAGYRIEALIGRGGMGAVYLAHHLRLGRKAAVKVLIPELAHDESFRERFIRESQMAAAFDHPNVIPIYDANEEDGVLYIAMRYVDGSDLKSVLEREGSLSPGRTLSIIEQTASALDAAHAHGLVHRDVKPANILIAPGERVYLTDFGVAKQASAGGLTQTGYFLGTVDYAAPEQIESKPVSPATDVYALGCVVYECFAGTPPFVKDSAVAVIHSHLVEAPPSLTADRPHLPTAVDDVIATALAKQPEARYPTCAALVAALRQALEPETERLPVAPTRAAVVPEPGPSTELPPASRPTDVTVAAKPRRRWLLPLLGVLAALAAAAVAFALVTSSDDDSPPTAVDDVNEVLGPVVSADSALGTELAGLRPTKQSFDAVNGAAIVVSDAVARAQGAAGALDLAQDDADVATRLDQALEANLSWAEEVIQAAEDVDSAKARAAEEAEGNTRRAYQALAVALPGVAVPPVSALSSTDRLVELTAVEVGETSARAANRAYVESIDRLLTNSAETRLDLGRLVQQVQGRSISFADARGRIDAIIGQRQNLQNAIATVTTPAPFRNASELLRSSIGAALDDDFAIQAWINAVYQDDPSAADRLAEHLAASRKASTAKQKFVDAYDRLRKQLLDLPPLKVGTSY
jgi:predicted Ser/Thr protein kinase